MDEHQMIEEPTVLVARQYVPKSKAVCIDCAKPFKFGENLFTKEGLAEIRISGLCEKCFDAIFEEMDE